jgi:aminoglycoside phosphotransferase (APT) family kinase protein
MAQMADTSPELQSAAQAAGLSVDTVLRRTDKTLLARGSLGGITAAVKFLTDPDPFWAGKLHHEIRLYELFTRTPPPVRAPRLLYTDHDRLLVLEWLDGHPLDSERYPRSTLSVDEVSAVLGCITALSQWRCPAAQFTATFDYGERLSRYHARGYLSDEDLSLLRFLLSQYDAADQINHGDPLASNILIGPAGSTVALLDWEFTGLFLPGFDLAMLHTQLGASTPAVRERIDAIVDEAGAQAAFAVNLAVVLTRELRIHRELPGGPVRDTSLEAIAPAWDAARERIRQLATRRSL